MIFVFKVNLAQLQEGLWCNAQKQMLMIHAYVRRKDKTGYCSSFGFRVCALKAMETTERTGQRFSDSNILLFKYS